MVKVFMQKVIFLTRTNLCQFRNIMVQLENNVFFYVLFLAIRAHSPLQEKQKYSRTYDMSLQEVNNTYINHSEQSKSQKNVYTLRESYS